MFVKIASLDGELLSENSGSMIHPSYKLWGFLKNKKHIDNYHWKQDVRMIIFHSVNYDRGKNWQYRFKKLVKIAGK